MADPNELSSGTQAFLSGAAFFVGQFFLTVWNNRKTKDAAADVKIATSSADQVSRLETRVMGLQRDMAAVNEKLNKVLPQDDRGPS